MDSQLGTARGEELHHVLDVIAPGEVQWDNDIVVFRRN